MDLTNSLKFIQSQKSPTAASVQEKLFIESIESQVQKTPQKVVKKSTSIPMMRPGKVEDALIQSKKQTEHKISLLQIKKRKEQQEALQSHPTINETSKLIASKSGKSFFSPKAAYVQSLLISSKVHKIKKMSKYGLIYKAKICLDNLDLRPSNCKSPLSYKVSKSSTTSESLHQKMLENYYSRGKNRRLFDVNPYRNKESLLDLNPIERNEQWLKLKKEKIEKNRKNTVERSMEHCTFHPDLSPKTSGSYLSAGFRSLDTNYSQRLSPSKCLSPLYETSMSGKRNFSPEIVGAELCNISLSPHRKKIGFRAGMDFKQFRKAAVPLARYSSPTPYYYYWNRVLRECLSR